MPPFRSGRVDHLYTFFVQWSPETYRKHMKPLYNQRDKQQKRHSVVEKKAAVANKHLMNRGPAAAKNWDVRTSHTHMSFNIRYTLYIDIE